MPLTISEEKPKIAEFLDSHPIAVLATVDSSGQPHAATIYFFVDPDLNLYFIARQETTKYRNLTANPKVALAVTESSTQTTVQIMGTAVELSNDDKLMDSIYQRILEITSETSQGSIPPFAKIPGGPYRCFVVKPQSVRMAEFLKPERQQFDNIFETV